MRLRVLSAAVLLPVALACLWFGGWAWFLLVLVLSCGLGIEWARLVQGGLPRWWLWSGLAYLGVLASCLDWLRADRSAGFRDVLFLLVVVWAADIGAYAVGRLVGGPKLAPAISPGKTWSGAVGGTFASALAGLCVTGLSSGLAWPVGVALLLSVSSQLGDLAESALKRRVGVKDSGNLLPGHGGLLDRLDGMLAATPVACLLAGLAGRGVDLWQ